MSIIQNFHYKLYQKIQYHFNRFRIKKIQILGASIGKGTISYGRFTVVNMPNLVIGENSTINEGVHINCRGKVEIGSNVHISTNVQIHTGKLNLDQFPRLHDTAPIIIEDNVWLASGVIILAGVKIGANSVVGAGSVVTKDVLADSLVIGIPALFKKKI